MADESNQDGGRGGLLKRSEAVVQLALAVPAGCVAGLLLGGWLDRHFQKHWMTVTGIILVSIGGFVQIFTAAIRSSKEKA